MVIKAGLIRKKKKKMVRAVIKNLIKSNTCYNCDYFRRFELDTCAHTLRSWMLPKERTCEKWRLLESLLGTEQDKRKKDG